MSESRYSTHYYTGKKGTTLYLAMTTLATNNWQHHDNYLSTSVFQHISISTHQYLSISAFQEVSFSAHQYFSLLAFEYISISIYQHVNTWVPNDLISSVTCITENLTEIWQSWPRTATAASWAGSRTCWSVEERISIPWRLNRLSTNTPRSKMYRWDLFMME